MKAFHNYSRQTLHGDSSVYRKKPEKVEYHHDQSPFILVDPNLPQNDVLLVLRTSKGTQSQRIPVIIKTWFTFSPETTHITTNGDIDFLKDQVENRYHSNLHFNNCTQAHSIRDLCCNSGKEFDIFFENQSQFKWLCRFDDDQYVNVPLLIRYLRNYSPDKENLYIGKPSIKEPKRGRGYTFWFATYGGGVCFSRSLLKKIRHDIYPVQNFIDGCVKSNFPDDTHIAYVLYKKYHINLTIANDFHHHIEGNQFVNLTNPSNLDEVITFGFKGSNIPHFFSLLPGDTYRMQTLHCLLYPTAKCLRLIRTLLNKFYEKHVAQ